MKSKMTLAVCLLSCAVILSMANHARAQTTANGPYYAWPAWDQTLACTTRATCPRFIVLSNMNGQAVLDRETGLVWEQSPSTTAWQWGGPGVPFSSSAQLHCNDSSVGNRKGWRLPTIQELASLIDPTVPPPGPTLPAGHPFSNVQSSSAYWSATTDTAFSSGAWGVGFGSGSVQDVGSKTTSRFVWCVRGAQGIDLQ